MGFDSAPGQGSSQTPEGEAVKAALARAKAEKAEKEETAKAEAMMTEAQKKLSMTRELSQQKIKERFGVDGHLTLNRDGSSLEGQRHEIWEMKGELNGKKVELKRVSTEQQDGTWTEEIEGTIDGQELTEEDTVVAIAKFEYLAVDQLTEGFRISDANHEIQEHAKRKASSAELLKSIGL